MARLVFHVGFGKTGSSSLQSYLSATAAQNICNSNYKYCALTDDSTVIHGKELVDRYKSSIIGNVNSFHNIAELRNVENIRREVHGICAGGLIPVFSQEDWGRRALEFESVEFLDAIDCDLDVIAYVRPQVDWFNSAWWQWFTWEEQFSKAEDVINAWGCDFMKWAAQLTHWKELKRVKTLTVRLHCGDVVGDFLNLLNINSTNTRSKYIYRNVGLSPEMIKLYRALPKLRTAHGSEIDGVLSEIVGSKGGSPWAVPEYLCKKIVAETHVDNLELLNYLDEPQRILMKQDRRWWTAAAFQDRKLTSERDLGISREECIAILSKVVPEVVRLQSQILADQKGKIGTEICDRSESDQEKQTCESLRRDLEASHQQIAALRESMSWKITAPLRTGTTFFRDFLRSFN